MNNNSNRQEHPRVEWEVAKIFSHEASGIAVEVSVLPLFLKPRYSWAITFKGNDETKRVRFRQVVVEEHNGRATLRAENYGEADIIKDLIEQAHIWIFEENQTRLDYILADKQRKEQRQLDRDKPKHRPGLKELAKRDARDKGVAPAK